ncbi:hypothetical protein NKH18_40865 [Streptomyces sp. M10(2022)]
MLLEPDRKKFSAGKSASKKWAGKRGMVTPTDQQLRESVETPERYVNRSVLWLDRISNFDDIFVSPQTQEEVAKELRQHIRDARDGDPDIEDKVPWLWLPTPRKASSERRRSSSGGSARQVSWRALGPGAPLPAAEVMLFVEGAGFQEGRENSTPYGSERVWVIAGELFFHYVHNAKTGVAYVQVTGRSGEDVERFTELSRSFFGPPDVAELITGVRSARASGERATALVKLAVGLPSAAPDEALQIIRDAFADDDPSLRRAALLSALYLDWEVVGPHVKDMERNDAAEELQTQARYFVDRNEGSS